VPDKEGHDKARGPVLYRTMPPCLKLPWRDDLSEIRITDHPARSAAEFLAFMQRHSDASASEWRFVKPTLVSTAPVKLASAAPVDIAKLCANYSAINPMYSEERLNCQHFAADLYGLLTRDLDALPYHPVCRLLYKQRRFDFFYSPEPLGVQLMPTARAKAKAAKKEKAKAAKQGKRETNAAKQAAARHGDAGTADDAESSDDAFFGLMM
jgi:hypothetical protein